MPRTAGHETTACLCHQHWAQMDPSSGTQRIPSLPPVCLQLTRCVGLPDTKQVAVTHLAWLITPSEAQIFSMHTAGALPLQLDNWINLTCAYGRLRSLTGKGSCSPGASS